MSKVIEILVIVLVLVLLFALVGVLMPSIGQAEMAIIDKLVELLQGIEIPKQF